MIKRVLLVLFSLLLISCVLYSMETLEKLRVLKKFNTITFSSKSLEEERDRKIAEISSTKKGEFEITEMYNKRMANISRQKQDIKDEYAQKIDIAQRKFNERKKEIEQEIQQLLDSSQEIVTSSISVGNYNADKQQFSIYVQKEGKSHTITVPLSIAPQFKQDARNIIAKGFRKLTVDEDWEYYNWSIQYNGQSYAFGTTSSATLPVYVQSKPTLPPDLKVVAVDFKDNNNDIFLEGDEYGTITIKIKNFGNGSASGITATLKSSGNYNFLEHRNQRFLSEIKPGEVGEIEFTIYADKNTPSQDCQYSIVFDESNGFFPDPVMCSFQTKKFEPPFFFVEKGIEDANGNYSIEQKELVTVTIRLANSGGDGKDVALNVRNPSSDVFFTSNSQTRFTWDTIEKGAFKDVSFEFYTNKKIKDDIPLSIVVTAEDYSREFPLNLKIKQKEISPKEFIFAGKEGANEDISIPGLVIDIEENIPQTNNMNKDAVAVVIGNRNYNKSSVPAVEFAHRDAAYMKKYLINTLGYREGNIIYVNDATQGDFLSIFGTNTNYKGKLYNYIKPGRSDVFIYYSGHGAPDPQSKHGFFVPVDCDPSLVALNGYSLDTFYKNLSKMDFSSLTVVIDACFSGSSEKGMLIEDISPVFIDVKNPVIASKNTTVFTSATGEQVSSWYRDKKHSLFSYYFMKGLQGNADKNKDNRLTVSELQVYIDDNVPYWARREKNLEQTPQVIGDKDRIIVEY
ncbi:MAG TPA: caspase family protein [Candidatus Cloacimonetes bacterium]|nr:caspase family protein [Candidatus Cloacimonadota bacterium]HEX37722.1 caspase family protein [Candidatus Cloacimonadota bacterium]